MQVSVHIRTGNELAVSGDTREISSSGQSERSQWRSLLTGEWVISRTDAKQRRIMHYWLTIGWVTAGTVLWLVLRNDLWFVGFMSLYAIWITHLAGWAAETPVEEEDGANQSS